MPFDYVSVCRIVLKFAQIFFRFGCLANILLAFEYGNSGYVSVQRILLSTDTK